MCEIKKGGGRERSRESDKEEGNNERGTDARTSGRGKGKGEVVDRSGVHVEDREIEWEADPLDRLSDRTASTSTTMTTRTTTRTTKQPRKELCLVFKDGNFCRYFLASFILFASDAVPYSLSRPILYPIRRSIWWWKNREFQVRFFTKKRQGTETFGEANKNYEHTKSDICIWESWYLQTLPARYLCQKLFL